MNLITVKLADPQRPVWVASLADYLRGDATTQVPDVPYWRNEIRRGALVEVTPVTPVPAVQIDGDAAVLPPMPSTKPPTSRKERRAAKRAASKPADPPPPADAERGPSLGSVITKAERFGDEE